MRFLLYILAFGFTFSLTGCFELIREIDIHKDGSGKLNVVVNFSQSESAIEMMLLLDEVNGHDVPTLDEIEQKCLAFTDSLKKAKGFSNVGSSFNRDDYIFEFSCEFDQVERLNQYAFETWKDKDTSRALRESYFRYDNHVFKENTSYRIAQIYDGMSVADREIFIGAQYTSIYRFEQEIISQENTRATVAPNNKVVVLQSPMIDLIVKPTFFNNTIKLNQ